MRNEVTKILNICLWFLESFLNGNRCISHIEKPSPVHILLMLQHRILPKIGTCHDIPSMTVSLSMVSLICRAVPAQLDFGGKLHRECSPPLALPASYITEEGDCTCLASAVWTLVPILGWLKWNHGPHDGQRPRECAAECSGACCLETAQLA